MKKQKQKQKQDLQYLLNKIKAFWKTNIYSEKIDIIKEFKDLYQHNNSKQTIVLQ